MTFFGAAKPRPPPRHLGLPHHPARSRPEEADRRAVCRGPLDKEFRERWNAQVDTNTRRGRMAKSRSLALDPGLRRADLHRSPLPLSCRGQRRSVRLHSRTALRRGTSHRHRRRLRRTARYPSSGNKSRPPGTVSAVLLNQTFAVPTRRVKLLGHADLYPALRGASCAYGSFFSSALASWKCSGTASRAP